MTKTPDPTGELPELPANDRGPTSPPAASGESLALVQEHYAPVYRLALACSESAGMARDLALLSLAIARRRALEPAKNTRISILAIAIEEIDRAVVRSHAAGTQSDLPTTLALGFEARLRQTVDSWDVKERQLAVLFYLLDRPTTEIARLLKVGVGAVQAQLDLFRQRAAAIFSSTDHTTVDAAAYTTHAHEPAASAALLAEELLVGYLDRRWPADTPTDDELEELSDEVARLAAGVIQAAASRLPMRLIGLGALLALVTCIGALIAVWQLRIGRSAQPSPTPLAVGLPTSFPPTPVVQPLGRRSDTAQILQRWGESSALWHSLALEAQIVDYGPVSYLGPPRRYLAQGWVLQPDQGIGVFSLLSGPLGQVSLVGGGRRVTRSYAANTSRSEEWSGEVIDLLPEGTLNGILRSMIFPSTSEWARRPGSLWWAEDGTVLEHSVIAFDWLNDRNQREARLWLDARTGVILRLQIFAGEAFDRLQIEAQAVEVGFQRREPPPALIVAARRSQEEDETTTGFQPILPTPTPAFAITPPALLPTGPAPAGIDPAKRRLVFQIPAEPQAETSRGDLTANLFADGYYLGQLEFTAPWGLRCHRSADGGRLAFNNIGDGASAPDDGLRWFNLDEPRKLYQPLPGFHAIEFAFSPDSRRLAAAGVGDWASGEVATGALSDGLYVIEIATGDFSHLLEVSDVRSLVWSPDGQYLALVGQLPNETQPALLVVHIATRTLAYQGTPGKADGPPPEDSPIGTWNVTFPTAMGELDDCAIPP